ncbi:MAG TPA: LysR substrate-binding domain-containing protein [Methylomirabilota bacterium]|jgi:DNA-binding transcriptional LysR family regulator|nr:LysR substrate-binding domain-containing protein [Methylomirabilota bacterium]
MTLRQLESFLAVVDLRSFRKAAERVALSQPALSQQIKELERELDTPILERLGRTTALTEAGRILEAHARRVLATLQGARDAIAGLQGLRHGSLVLGASSTPGIYLLPRVLARFTTRYPGVDVTLRIGNTRETEARVRASEVDLAVVGGHLSGAEETCTEASLLDRLVLIVGRGHPWGRAGQLAAQRLREARLLVREEGSATRQVTETALARAGIPVRARLELGHTEAIKEGVRAGLGVAFVSEHAVRHELGTGELRVVRVSGLTIQRHFHVIRHQARVLSPAARAFLECLHAHQPPARSVSRKAGRGPGRRR